MQKLHRFIYFINDMRRRYREHHITAFSAQMSYFFLLSLFPFLIFLVSLISFFSIENVWMLDSLKDFLPEGSAHILISYIEDLAAGGTSVMSVSIIAAVFSASKALNALMRAMNIVYEVTESRGYLSVRLLGMLYTIMFALSIVLALILPSMGKDFFNFIGRFIALPPMFVEAFTSLRWLGVLLLLLLVLGSTHVILPNFKVSIRDAVPGTLFSLVGWFAISVGFSYFVQNFGRLTIVYGSLTAVILLMIWMYMSSIIIMLGGEINHFLISVKNGSESDSEHDGDL